MMKEPHTTPWWSLVCLVPQKAIKKMSFGKGGGDCRVETPRKIKMKGTFKSHFLKYVATYSQLITLLYIFFLSSILKEGGGERALEMILGRCSCS